MFNFHFYNGDQESTMEINGDQEILYGHLERLSSKITKRILMLVVSNCLRRDDEIVSDWSMNLGVWMSITVREQGKESAISTNKQICIHILMYI